MALDGVGYVLVLGAVLLLVLLPIIPRSTIVVCIVGARSFTDIGAASAGSLLPSSLLSLGLGVLAIIAALLPTEPRLYKGDVARVWLLGAGVLASTAIFCLRFGISAEAVEEPVRVASIIAIYVLARREAEASPDRSITQLVYVGLPAALILCLGFASQNPILMSSGARAAGSFSHPNAAAAFLSIAAVIAIGAGWSSGRRKWQIVGIIAALGTLFTLSLGGMLGLVSGLLTFVLMNAKFSLSKKLAVVLGFTGAVYFAISRSALIDRLDEIRGIDIEGALSSGNSSNSLEWRFINWSEYLEIWREQPFFGFGIGSSYGEVMPLGGPPHSLFVQFLFEFGIIGAVMIAIMFAAWLRTLTSQRRKDWRAVVMLSCVTLAVINGSESNLFGYTSAMYLLAFAVGVLGSGRSRDGALDPTPASFRTLRK
ncbi:O-antigen ligase family protein [Arthrobacter sp. EH-1B-1]|uniref:O-antigen ligase family protein n=1 Tax=Arthrobacter vasquezii TaxID=2977629 RepID=A0ABT6CXC4_9MICC|nr:O-antigen ligase family protein [Arthrobacter vasquezii]MDF9278732.1 O-antigen ligase family protein [Arthrobacter vasquezii]